MLLLLQFIAVNAGLLLTSKLAKLFIEQVTPPKAVLVLMSKALILVFWQSKYVKAVLALTSILPRLLSRTYKPVKAAKASIPVKSVMLRLLPKISPVKAAASLTCISASVLVFIAVLPTKYALKFASGIFTFWPKAPNPITFSAIVNSNVLFMFSV